MSGAEEELAMVVVRLWKAAGFLAVLIGVGATAGFVAGGWRVKEALVRPPAPRIYAIAHLRGGPLAPDIRGTVAFRSAKGGTIVSVRVKGLPEYRAGDPPTGRL